MPAEVPARAGPVGLRLVAQLCALLVGCALLFTPATAAERFSSVRVDIRPLLAQGGGLQAEALAGALQAALRQSFADRLGGNGPALVVRVTGLTLAPYAGSQGGRGGFGGGGPTDYLDGEALVVGRRGDVLLRHPQLSALPSSSGGAWYDSDSERRRLVAIAEHYADWLRRRLPFD